MYDIKQIIDKWEVLILETLVQLEATLSELDQLESLLEAGEIRRYIDDKLKFSADLEEDQKIFYRATFLIVQIRRQLILLEAGCRVKATTKVKEPKDPLSEIQKLLGKLTPAELEKLTKIT